MDRFDQLSVHHSWTDVIGEILPRLYCSWAKSQTHKLSINEKYRGDVFCLIVLSWHVTKFIPNYFGRAIYIIPRVENEIHQNALNHSWFVILMIEPICRMSIQRKKNNLRNEEDILNLKKNSKKNSSEIVVKQ